MKNILFTLLFFFQFSFFATPVHHGNYQLIIFEGSDWCVKCIQLEKKILSDSDFLQSLEKQHIELVKVDFPQKKNLSKDQQKSNEQLAETYQFDGQFPSIVLSRTDTLAYHKINYTEQNKEDLINDILTNLQRLQ